MFRGDKSGCNLVMFRVTLGELYVITNKLKNIFRKNVMNFSFLLFVSITSLSALMPALGSESQENMEKVWDETQKVFCENIVVAEQLTSLITPSLTQDNSNGAPFVMRTGGDVSGELQVKIQRAENIKDAIRNELLVEGLKYEREKLFSRLDLHDQAIIKSLENMRW